MKRVVKAMIEGDAKRACELLQAVRPKSNGVPRARLREAFFTLLERRGFLVGTAEERGRSLEEIRAVGEGFDLFEIARNLGIREGGE